MKRIAGRVHRNGTALLSFRRYFPRHTVNFCVPNRRNAEKSKPPGDETLRVLVVETEVSGCDPGREMAAERGNGFADLID